MPPNWLTVLADVSLILAFLCAFVVLADVLAGHRQEMGIMNVVWPITPLYLGPLGLWAYYAIGRTKAKAERPGGDGGRTDQDKPQQKKEPSWRSVFTGVTHCGAGCTLGDVVAEFGVFFLGLTIAGAMIWPAFIADFALAYLFGIVFQYFSIAPMRGLGLKDGLIAAVKADTLSITAYEVGMVVWMALVYFVFFHPHLKPDQPVYWFMMQIAMLVGFATAYPMNRWLIQKGLKEVM